jgi:hypothetical protein
MIANQVDQGRSCIANAPLLRHPLFKRRRINMMVKISTLSIELSLTDAYCIV